MPLVHEERRSRRIYALKADDAIYAAFARYQFLTADIATVLLGREHDTVQKRFQMMYEAGHLNRVRESLIDPYVYFLDKEGAKRALDLGELPELRYINSKSRMMVNHDLEITQFHFSLDQALTGKAVIGNWKQWRDDLRDSVQTRDGRKSIIPDAYILIDGQGFPRPLCFFLEITKSYESEYTGGKSNIEQKLALYMSYKARFQEKYGPVYDDFRVLYVLPTVKRVQMLLGKIEDEFPYRKFWFTDEASYKRDILGKIWWTPKDFRDRTYSLLETKSQ